MPRINLWSGCKWTLFNITQYRKWAKFVIFKNKLAQITKKIINKNSSCYINCKLFFQILIIPNRAYYYKFGSLKFGNVKESLVVYGLVARRKGFRAAHSFHRTVIPIEVLKLDHNTNLHFETEQCYQSVADVLLKTGHLDLWIVRFWC